MNEITKFNHEQFGEIRIYDNNNEPWFIARDIALALGYSNPAEAIRDNCDESDIVSSYIPILSNTYTLINESAIYDLILSSKKKEAKTFKKWVTHEVLPSIRKHGGYLTPEKTEEILNNPDLLIQLATALKTERAEKQKALAQAEYQNQALTTSQVKNGILTKTVKKLKNQLKGYDEYVSLNSFLSINKISLWSKSKKTQCSSKGIVAKLKKLGIDGNEWILKTYEGQEFPTTIFDPDFLASCIVFIQEEVEKLVK